MKLKFKKQIYQQQAVAVVTECFAGQPNQSGFQYYIDLGKTGQ